jgi:prepilin-type N-terminal cleavage/methylation domain-containing protein/prepilin-type processing-associated H-X9-DG protein
MISRRYVNIDFLHGLASERASGYFENAMRNNGTKNAFTLVELLVVISIIALLLAMLMPSLNRARGLAKSVVCASNQKQIALAFYMYMNSLGKGLFPPYWDNNKSTQPAFQVFLYKDVGSNDKVFKCPAAPSPQHAFWPNTEKTPYFNSYAYNVAIGGYPYYGASGTRYSAGVGKVKLLSLKQPNTIIVFSDIMMSYNKHPLDLNLWGPFWGPFQQSIIADWHKGKSNIIFADFSVAKHPSKEQYSGGKINAGWYPLGR